MFILIFYIDCILKQHKFVESKILLKSRRCMYYKKVNILFAYSEIKYLVYTFSLATIIILFLN